MTDRFLNKVYDARTADETRDLYDAWSTGYDSEVAENGYATPRRVAEALYAHLPGSVAPILDYGCGTGLSGLALKLAGFDRIDGADLSPEMLVQAQAKTVYRQLWQVGSEDAPPGNPGDYAAITAIGVIGAGAAPISLLDRLMAHLDTGGLLAFSFNDHALADSANEGRVNEHVDTGSARLLMQEYGPHLPGLNLKSTVYVLEKL